MDGFSGGLFARRLADVYTALVDGQAFGDTRLTLPDGHYDDILSGQAFTLDARPIEVARLWSRFPMALLLKAPDA